MKTCTKCNTIKELSEFSKRSAAKDGLNSWCKSCKRVKDNAYYSDSLYRQGVVKAARDAARQVRRELIWNYLSDHPCVDCGESDIVVLEFDHVRGEKFDNIASLVRSLAKIEVIVSEIEKCEVRCANDHRRVTAQRGGGRMPD